MTKEEIRLAECQRREKHWKRWGPYLSERAWGTVREDYSPYGNAWEYLPHDHAQTGFADKFRSHIPERSPITLMYGNLASHWLADPLKRSSITRESTSPDWL
jgi:hypothetical protein